MADPRLRSDVALAEAPGGRPVLTGYLDTRGVPTAGYGHTGPDVVVGRLYTEQQCEDWLDADIDEHMTQAQTLPEWAALDTQARQNAVIECVFNLGLAHWQNEFPRTRKALQAKLWQSAAANLLNSPEWIAEVHLPRVQRIAQQIQSGTYPS